MNQVCGHCADSKTNLEAVMLMAFKICSGLWDTEQPAWSVGRGEGQGEAHGVDQMLLAVFVSVNRRVGSFV